MKKRILSTLLAAALIFMVLPVQASAVSVGSADDLAAKLTELGCTVSRDGNVVVLEKYDYEAKPETITITGGTITLRLNLNDIDYDDDDNPTPLFIVDGGNLTIERIFDSGVLYGKDNPSKAGDCIVLESGSLTITENVNIVGGYFGGNAVVVNGGTLTITGGILCGNENGSGIVINGGEVNISAGSVYGGDNLREDETVKNYPGGDGIILNSGTLNISGEAEIIGGSGFDSIPSKSFGGKGGNGIVVKGGNLNVSDDVVIAGGDGYSNSPLASGIAGDAGDGIVVQGGTVNFSNMDLYHSVKGGFAGIDEGAGKGGNAMTVSGGNVTITDMLYLYGGDGKNGGDGLALSNGSVTIYGEAIENFSEEVIIGGGDGEKGGNGATVSGGTLTTSGLVKFLGGDGTNGGNGIAFRSGAITFDDIPFIERGYGTYPNGTDGEVLSLPANYLWREALEQVFIPNSQEELILNEDNLEYYDYLEIKAEAPKAPEGNNSPIHSVTETAQPEQTEENPNTGAEAPLGIAAALSVVTFAGLFFSKKRR